MDDAVIDSLITGLPGETLVRQGIADLRSGRRTIDACAVDTARIRLRGDGLRWETPGPPSAEPELELYDLLRREGGDAYSRYNAILRELVSFEAAFARRVRAMRGGRGVAVKR
jgi:hypothetical protein